MIDMQMGTEDIVNILEPEAMRGEAIEPGLLWKVRAGPRSGLCSPTQVSIRILCLGCARRMFGR